MRRALLVLLLGLATACGGSTGPPAALPTTVAPTTASPTPAPTPAPVVTTVRPTPAMTSRPPSPRPRRTSASPRPVRTSARPRPVPTTARPLPPGANSVFVLGDSVLISPEPYVRAALSGWVVTYDAYGSRRLPQGIQVLKARRSEIGRVVVIMLGNNYIASEGSFADQIDQAMRVLRGTSRVVWLTVAEKWPSRVTINQAIRAAASRWPTIVVGDWAPIIAAHPEYAYDQLHLAPDGRRAIARLIARCVGPAP